MVKIKGRKYNLCLFDTNTLSELLLSPERWIRYFDETFGLARSIICYSVFSLSELWQRQELFEKYIDMFSVFPSVMLDGYQGIFDKEIENYRERNSINPVVVAPFAVRAPDLSPKEKITKLIEQSRFIEKTKIWRSNRKEILEGILSLIKNYPPKSTTYTTKEIEHFVMVATT